MIVFQRPENHSFTPVKIAFLTGLSYPNDCALSSVQTQFLKHLQCCESWKVYQNFPYILQAKPATPQLMFMPDILTTSISNIKQYYLASSHRYKTAAKQHLTQLAMSCEHLFLIVGSCGLEILNHALTVEVKQKLRYVFAFGPVAKALPSSEHMLIQGRQDYISKAFFKNVDCLIPDMGHLGYLENDLVFQRINTGLQHELSKLKVVHD